MKRLYVLLFTFILSIISIFTSFGAEKLGAWETDNVGTWYKYKDGTYPTCSFFIKDEKLYYVNQDGYLVPNSQLFNGYKTDSYGAIIGHSSTNDMFSSIYNSDGWRQSEKGWWYQNIDGTYPKNTNFVINGKWYWVDSDGYMLHDCYARDGVYYGSDGAYTTNIPEVAISIPNPTGYGSVKGNVTWQYNKYVGTKADVGSVVYLIPLDFSIKDGGNENLSMFMDTKGKNNVYYSKVDGFGQYVFDNVPSGKYIIFIKSNNTNYRLRFEEEGSWDTIINNLMGNVLNKKELKSFKTFLGYDSFYYTEIEIVNDKNNTISHDFGYTYT